MRGEPWQPSTLEEAEEWQEQSFLHSLAETLEEVEQAWRCQLGSDLFASCVDCARAGLIQNKYFDVLDSDMVAYYGDQDWHHNAPPLKYGPHLPWWHPIKRAEVDDDLPF